MLKFEKEWLINSIEFGDLCENRLEWYDHASMMHKESGPVWSEKTIKYDSQAIQVLYMLRASHVRQ